MKTIKNLFSVLALCAIFLISNFASAQSDKVKIDHCVDKISKRHYYMTDRLVMLDKSSSKGMVIQPKLGMKGDSIELESIIFKQANICSCQENSKLYFLFEDDEVVTLKSWNKFNCDGLSYFDFNTDELRSLKTKKIKSIRFENGYKFATFTYSLNNSEASYFIRLLSNYTINEIECND